MIPGLHAQGDAEESGAASLQARLNAIMTPTEDSDPPQLFPEGSGLNVVQRALRFLTTPHPTVAAARNTPRNIPAGEAPFPISTDFPLGSVEGSGGVQFRGQRSAFTRTLEKDPTTLGQLAAQQAEFSADLPYLSAFLQGDAMNEDTEAPGAASLQARLNAIMASTEDAAVPTADFEPQMSAAPPTELGPPAREVPVREVPVPIGGRAQPTVSEAAAMRQRGISHAGRHELPSGPDMRQREAQRIAQITAAQTSPSIMDRFRSMFEDDSATAVPTRDEEAPEAEPSAPVAAAVSEDRGTLASLQERLNGLLTRY